MEQQVDVLIMGAGMAGASAAYYLAAHRRVAILEREAHPGYHSTGRSAALYSETYGNVVVRGLTRASKAFYLHPPAGFSQVSLLSARGALFVGGDADEPRLRQTLSEMQSLVPTVHWLDRGGVLDKVPVLRAHAARFGVFEPEAMDMDVHAIHHGFLRGAQAAGAKLFGNAEVQRIEALDGGWRVTAGDQVFRAEVLINAAGAWCDQVARMAGVATIGLVPKRRTAFVTDAPTEYDIRAWPLVIDAQERFYFKPDAGMLLMSPANEDPVEPQDVQAEALDIAIAVDRIEAATSLRVRQVRRHWAGLRSFVTDKTPVVGFAPRAPGFFWLAGQGGYGIQTAPAMGVLTAALVQGQSLPAELAACGLRSDDLSPSRPGLAAVKPWG